MMVFFVSLLSGWALAHNTHTNKGYYHGLGDGTDFDNHFHPFNEHEHPNPHNNFIGWGYIDVGLQFWKWAEVNHNHYDYTGDSGDIYSELYAFATSESLGANSDHILDRHRHCHHNNFDNFCANSP
jgi:hypothetical protein